MRETRIIAGLAALVLAVAAVQAVTGQQGQQAPLGIEEVKDGLYVITGGGGNVAARVTNEGVILVDDKFERNVAEIRERVRSVTDQPVRYVLGTHHHGDHMGGNTGFAATAEIIAHSNARANMIRGDQPTPPSVIFTDQTAVHLGGVEVQARYVGRGHTNGDAIIVFPDLETIHTGDLVVGGTPFIDYANGGNSFDWVATLENILEIDFDTVIPGHGPVMTRDDVTSFRDHFLTLRERMSELVSQDVPKAEVVDRLQTDDLNWPLDLNGLFVQRSLSSFYDEIRSAQ